MNFTEAAEKYLRYYEVTKAHGTFVFNRSKTNVLVEYFKERDCSTIDETSILELILYLREKNPYIENATVNKYVGVVKRIIRYAIDVELKFDKLPEVKKLVQTIPDKVINKIFKHLKNDMHPESARNLLMFMMLLDTGLRISELLNLKISNFNFETNTIHVTETKTKVHRYVFFREETSQLLTKFILKYQLKSIIFIKLQTRKKLSVDNVQKLCQRLHKSLKLKVSITPHKWRHTFATKFIENNGNMEVLRILMGHTTLTTTQRYLHVGSDKLRSEYMRVVR